MRVHLSPPMALLLVLVVLPLTAAGALPDTVPAVHAEILVLGGSPAGVAAAVAAARRGHTVILAEPRPFLGTVLTASKLNVLDVNRDERGQTITEGVFGELYRALGPVFDPARAHPILLRLLRAARVSVWLNARIDAPLLEAGRVRGVLLDAAASSDLTSWVTIDATEDADVAAAAGVPYTVGREDSRIDREMQPATLMLHLRGLDWAAIQSYVAFHDKPLRGGVHGSYVWGLGSIVRKYRSPDPRIRAYDLNLGRLPDGTAWLNALQVYGVDGTDPASTQAGYVRALRALPSFMAFLRGQVPGFADAVVEEVAPELYIRETRHIVGLYRLQASDIVAGRRFPDAIAEATYPIDLHPDAEGRVNPFLPQRRRYTIPLRSLIPARVDDLLVASRAFSASYQAAGSARIVATTMALGEAAGITAAVAVEHELSVHEVIRDPRLLSMIQRRLEALRRGGMVATTEPAVAHPAR